MGRGKSLAVQVQRNLMKRVNQVSSSRRGKEQEKRDRMLAELQHELAQPLTPGVTLTRKERAEVAERVLTGISAQSFYAKGGSVTTKMGDV